MLLAVAVAASELPVPGGGEPHLVDLSYCVREGLTERGSQRSAGAAARCASKGQIDLFTQSFVAAGLRPRLSFELHLCLPRAIHQHNPCFVLLADGGVA